MGFNARVLPLRAAVALALAVIVPSATTAKLAPREAHAVDGTEALLQKAIADIGHQRFDTALVHIDNLIKLQPNFRLAHLIRGDLLLARVRPLSEMGSASGGSLERLGDLRQEAVARLRALREKP